MPEFRDRPVRHSVALRTIIPEQFTVRINRRVTLGAVQHGRIGCDTDVIERRVLRGSCWSPCHIRSFVKEKNHVISETECFFHEVQRQQRVLLARTGLNRRGHGGAEWLSAASLKPRSLGTRVEEVNSNASFR